jgi:hypothetical protein
MRTALIASAATFLAITLACGSTAIPDVSLTGGFMPDPVTSTVNVDGTVQASDALLPSSCVGYMNPNTASYTVALSDMSEAFIGACSSTDVALAVRGPDGTWSCDDDTEGTNPVVGLTNPNGTYEIFVARYSDDTVASAVINVSESGGPFCGGGGGGSETVNMIGTPSSGSTTVASGFGSSTTSVTAGGSTDVDNVSSIPSNCTGYIDGSAPTHRLDVSSGLGALRIASCADNDTTLVINDGDGNWHCNDDEEGSNPVVTVNGPTSGTWDIWVGTYSSGGGSASTLKLSEATSGTLCN